MVFVALNVDYIVIGRTLGPHDLGLYLLAFNLAALPSSVITTAIRTVAIPAFGRMYAAGSLGGATKKLVRGVAWVAFPVCALIGGLAIPLMGALYGQRWVPGAVALLGLSLFGAARILTEVFSDLCVGAGSTIGLFWVQLLWLIALIPVMVIAVNWWGIAGAGYAHAIVAWLVVVPAYLAVLTKAIGVRWRTQVWAFLPLLPAAGVAGVVAALLAGLLSNAWLAILAGGTGGALVYLLLTMSIARTVITGIKEAQ